MTQALAHRGPDDEGYLLVDTRLGDHQEFSGPTSPAAVKALLPSINEPESSGALDADLALGHRRFAIISPTPDGHQPFWDASRRTCLVLNGEIYNYIEVRRELERLGRAFRTGTDTEVLVEAYREWGDACFERLNGMWAMALYDFDKRELVLCRDRTGERPLYWLRRPDGIFFASEIKALLAGASISDRRVEEEVAYNFLTEGLSDLDSRTFFRGVESLPTATVVRMDLGGRITERRFWRAPKVRPRVTESSVPELCSELRDLLRDSVRLRLRADVPVNVALSGGLDSSSVVAMSATLCGAGVETYTVRFAEKQWNEWPFAEAVADRYRVQTMVIDPQPQWVWSHLEQFVTAMEEPFHAPDLVPDYVVRGLLADRGIKVSLSGIGGDELFAGYAHYRMARILELKHSGRRASAWREILLSSESAPVQTLGRVLASKLHGERRDADATNVALRIEALSAFSQTRHCELPQETSERLWADVDWALLPYWLRAGDKSSMAIPIEIRYPFLDHRLIEFAMRLPVALLIRNGWMKWILRKSMEGMLPRQVTWRRRKMGFPFPIAEWLEGAKTELQRVFREMDNPYLQSHFWSERLSEMIESDPWLVWRALSFELWHRHYIRGLTVLPERVAAYAEAGRDIHAIAN